MKIVLPGATGKLGRIVARHLVEAGHTVVGIDVRGWPDAPPGVEVHQVDIRKRGAEEIFRKTRPDAAVHMATVTHLKEQSEDRYRINLGGTRAVFDACAAHGVKQAIFVGRHTFYGAASDSPLYHTEDEPPIGATRFPELADLVAADLYAGQALWRLPQLTTAVLRVCYTLGPSRHGTLASFLARSRVPTVLGFDPLFQFMHEEDVARAIVLALDKKVKGVFNVAGPGPLPLSQIIRAAGRTPIPIPEPIFRLALGRFGLQILPRGALAHIKYPVIIDAGRFREATGFAPRFSDMETIAAFRDAAR
jgi:UDP-glucose 4-epimerase